MRYSGSLGTGESFQVRYGEDVLRLGVAWTGTSGSGMERSGMVGTGLVGYGMVSFFLKE
jgi:hypothetical protein